MKIIKAEEKVMVPLTNKECKSYPSQKNLLHFQRKVQRQIF